MASTPTRLMTFEEFEQLPTPTDGRLELRHGQIVKTAPLIYDHFLIQQILRDLLDRAAAGRGRAYTRLGFRGLTNGEYWIARVAYVSKERWVRQEPEGYFDGAPDLVVEILSPSNTAAEIADKRTLCLETGCREFWTLDIGKRRIDVSTPGGHTITYKAGQEIPLFFGGRIPVDAIFSEGA